jgi:predicted dienelactone hydrolase
MIPMLRVAALWLVVFCGAPLFARESPYSVTDLTWHDSSRDRDVPARIYAPASGQGPFPVIIFSHGLGGSRTGYAYLGAYWAGRGYIVVHVQHLGSDSAVLWPLEKMGEAMRNPENYINRPKDISFAIDQLTAMNASPGPWQGRFDLAHIGVAGHSFGGYTTMAIAGAPLRPSSGEIENFRDPRVKAVVAMSVPPVKSQDFSAVHVPALHITGTDDQIHIVAGDAVTDRRIPYDQAKGPDTYLVIFKGANHMSFSGREGLLETNDQKAIDATVHELVLQVTTAFWDAYLKNDPKAMAWLTQDGFAQVLGAKGTFEKK